jgi:hypothetical protein
MGLEAAKNFINDNFIKLWNQGKRTDRPDRQPATNSTPRQVDVKPDAFTPQKQELYNETSALSINENDISKTFNQDWNSTQAPISGENKQAALKMLNIAKKMDQGATFGPQTIGGEKGTVTREEIYNGSGTIYTHTGSETGKKFRMAVQSGYYGKPTITIDSQLNGANERYAIDTGATFDHLK